MTSNDLNAQRGGLPDDQVLGYRFPGGKYTIQHWENFLLTDCTTADQLPDGLVHPVALFHVPILGSGISITKLFEVCGAEGPGSVGLDGYDWEYFSSLRIDTEYDVQGSIVHWEHMVDDKGNPYDAMKFSIELRDVAKGNALVARVTNSWRFRRQHATAAYKKPAEHTANDTPTQSERIADCSTPDQARELHQIRDTFVLVDDPVGGGSGRGNCQPIVAGPFERWGLGADDSFW